MPIVEATAAQIEGLSRFMREGVGRNLAVRYDPDPLLPSTSFLGALALFDESIVYANLHPESSANDAVRRFLTSAIPQETVTSSLPQIELGKPNLPHNGIFSQFFQSVEAMMICIQQGMPIAALAFSEGNSPTIFSVRGVTPQEAFIQIHTQARILTRGEPNVNGRPVRRNTSATRARVSL